MGLREQTPRQKSKHKGTFMPAMSKNKRDDYKARHNIGEVGQSGKPRSALGRLQAGEQPTGSCMPVSPTPSLNLSESDISLATDRSDLSLENNTTDKSDPDSDNGADGPWTCPECDHVNAFGDMCCDECNF